MCDRVKYSIDGTLDDVSFCHCSICRKTSGSAFAAYAATSINQFKWLQGENLLREFKVSELLTKYFCSNCGSSLLTCHASDPDFYHISLGCLNEATQLKPQYHQFVGSKASWYTPLDDLPKFKEWPDEE